MSIARLSWFLFIGAVACSGLTLEDRPCPCTTGWTCCVAANVCVREGSTCPTHADGGTFCDRCPTPENAIATCDGTRCGVRCKDGYLEVDGACTWANADWSPQTSGTDKLLFAVWGSGPGDVYVVGQNATIMHSTGRGDWSPEAAPVAAGDGAPSLFAIWGSSATDVYAVGQLGTILRSRGGGLWAAESSGTTDNMLGVWGSGATDVYVVGVGGTILHSNGDGQWLAEAKATTDALAGVSGFGPAQVLAIDQDGGAVLRSDGAGTWTAEQVSADASFAGIWRTTANEVYVVGAVVFDSATGVIYRWNRDTLIWSEDARPSGTLAGVWGTTQALYAVGALGTAVYSTGGSPATWGRQVSGTTSDLEAVWGSGVDDVYAVGSNGTILHRP